MGQLNDIEADLPETGLGREHLLAFVRLVPTNDVVALKSMLAAWLERMQSEGVEIEQVWVDRLLADFERDGRISPETVHGLSARPDISLSRRGV